MRFHSLRFRVLVSLLAAFLLGFGVLAYHLYDTRDQLRRGMVYIHAQEIARALTAESDFGQLPLQYMGGELSYTLYGADGHVLWYSDNLERPRRLRTGTLDQEAGRFSWAPRSGFVINVPVRLSDGSVLMVAKEDRQENRVITEFLQARVLQGLIVLLPFCLSGLVLVLGLLHWTLRPVREAARLAADIGPHDPDRRIPLDKLPREIVPLARAANSGLERLSQAYEYEQTIVADAAHELRTPLSVLSLQLQKCRRDGYADWSALESEVAQACKRVNQLLLLARVDRMQTGLADGRANLPRIVREAAAKVLPLFEERGRPIETNIDGELWVKGDPEQLREAVRNVLENALFHGEGLVRITLSAAQQGVIALDIADEGEGVEPDSQEEMFRRFRKGHQSEAGSGLGLAIVRRILRNAGGDACFISNRPCVVRMSFEGAVQAPPRD